MQCVGCGTQTDPQHRFCPGCGAPLDSAGDVVSGGWAAGAHVSPPGRTSRSGPRLWMLVALLVAGGMLGGALVGGIGLSGARAEISVLESKNASLEDANAQLTENSARIVRLYERALEEVTHLEDAKAELSAEVASLRHIRAPFTYHPTSRSEYTVGTVHSDDAVLIGFPNAEEDFVWTSTRGTSMRPFFGTGARLIGTTRFEPEDIAVGDIISFELIRGRRIAHQVIEIQDDGVITKGFNNPEDDGLIPWEAIRTLWIGVIF